MAEPIRSTAVCEIYERRAYNKLCEKCQNIIEIKSSNNTTNGY